MKPRTSASTGPTPDGLEWDASQNITRAQKYLRDEVQAGRVAIEDDERLNGNQRLYDIGCMLWDLMVSEEMARKLVWEIFNPHCRPPWGSQDTSFVTALGRAYNGGAGNDNPGTKGHADPNFVFRAYLASGAAADPDASDDIGPDDAPEGGTETPWPDPQPLDGTKEAEDARIELPRGLLPPTTEAFIFMEAEAKSFNPADIVLPLLCISGGLMPTALAFRCTDSAEYPQYPALFVMLNADTLSGKSLLINTARAPMKVIQARRMTESKKTRAAYTTAKKTFDTAFKKYEKDAEDWRLKQIDPNHAPDLKEAPSRPAEPEEVKTQRFYTTDTTTEALKKRCSKTVVASV